MRGGVLIDVLERPLMACMYMMREEILHSAYGGSVLLWRDD